MASQRPRCAQNEEVGRSGASRGAEGSRAAEAVGVAGQFLVWPASVAPEQPSCLQERPSGFAGLLGGRPEQSRMIQSAVLVAREKPVRACLLPQGVEESAELGLRVPE